MTHFKKGMKALIHPTRGRIAEMFQERAMCVIDSRIVPGGEGPPAQIGRIGTVRNACFRIMPVGAGSEKVDPSRPDRVIAGENQS